MATHSSVIAWGIPGTGEPGGCRLWGHTESDMTEALSSSSSSKITADGDCSHEIKRCLLLGRKADKRRQCVKKQRHHFADKGPYNESYDFSST